MYPKILIPVDGSACSQEALREGLMLAKALDSDVVLLHVVEEPMPLVTDGFVYPSGLYEAVREAGEEVLRSAKDEADAREVEAVARLVERGRPAVAIVDAARDADLVVIGTHGRRGFDRFVFGSVAESVLRRCPVPCLAVRRPESAHDDTDAA